MLTQEQRDFLRKYVLSGATDTGDHAKASALVAQVAFEETAKPVRDQLAAFEVPEKATDAERTQILAEQKIGAVALAGTLDDAKIDAARLALASTQTLIEAAQARIHAAQTTWDAAVQSLKEDVLEDSPIVLSTAQSTALTDAITTATKDLAPDLSNADALIIGFEDLRKSRKLLTDLIPPMQKRIKAVSEGLADALQVELVDLKRWSTDSLIAVDAVIDAPTAKHAVEEIKTLEAKRRVIENDIAARKKTLGSLSAVKLEAAVKELGSVAALNDIVAAAGPAAKILLDDSKISPANLAQVFNGCLGGDAKALACVFETGFDSDPAKLVGLITTFPDTTTNLGKDDDYNPRDTLIGLINQGGFGDKPEALGEMLGTGCGGDPAKLETFCKEFRKDADQVKLSGLLNDGGLGDSPKAFAHVVAMSDGLKVTKDLCTEFDSPAKLAKLENLVVRGGMGGGTSRSPGALASIIEKGLDGNVSKLTAYHDGFKAEGMDDLSAMISAFHDPGPPPSDPGPQFKFVTGKACPPPSDLKDLYFKNLDQQAQGSAARAALSGVNASLQVSAAAQALGEAPSDAAKAQFATTWAAASALDATQDVTGVDARLKQLLTDAIAALSTSTALQVELDNLADPTKARLAATQAITSAAKSDSGPLFDQKTKDANDAAVSAGAAAKLAAANLKAGPVTKTLLDEAAAKASDAIAKAKLAPDDAIRAEAMTQAKACLDQLKQIADTQAQSLLADVKTKAETASGAASDAVKVKVPYTPTEKSARDTAMAALDAANDRLAKATLASMVQSNPALMKQQAEAARLSQIARQPGASPEQALAATKATREVSKALAASAKSTVTTSAALLKAPSADPALVADNAANPVNSAAELLETARALKVAMAAALLDQETLNTQYNLLQTKTLNADETASRTSATQKDKDIAKTLKAELNLLDADVEAASNLSEEVAAHASALGKSVNKNIKVVRKRHGALPAGAAKNAQKAQLDALLAASAEILVIVKKSAAAGYPAMNRDQLLSVSSGMKRNSVSAISATATVKTGVTADMKHFCGRHSRDHFAFQGRDLRDEDELLDAVLLEAQLEGIGNSARTQAQKDACKLTSQMKTTSLWPAGFGEAEIKTCLLAAITAMEDRMKADTATPSTFVFSVNAYLNLAASAKTHTGTSFKNLVINPKINGKTATFTVALGVTKGSGTDFSVGQFYPSSTPSVPFFDMHGMKKALKY